MDELSDGGRRVPLLVDLDGHVLEAAWANVWILDGHRLLTPPADGRLLPGVTRAALLQRAGSLGLAAAEEPLGLERVAEAGIVLLTSSIRVAAVGCLHGDEPSPEALALAARIRELLGT